MYARDRVLHQPIYLFTKMSSCVWLLLLLLW